MSNIGAAGAGAAEDNSGKFKEIDGRVRIAELVLRFGICATAIVAFVLIMTDTQVREFFTIQKTAKFSDMKSLIFLVVANGIVAAYSFVQGVRCIVTMLRGNMLLSKPLAWAIFSCDQVIAYLTVAAVAAALQSSIIGQFGEPKLQWMELCSLYGKFCKQAGEGLVSAVIASLGMVAISGISAFSLFRLYHGNNGSWLQYLAY
ncbi:CASP-like protein 2B1 [Impatiens glandulifera]|uniref:CASP-like protein 2B1 n=1 Tax=Impatiens glandulifera TaxID=253017 RepID=UPI001FB19A51|nr:CASP-like protein 2B1 [Impatiens glandulifera]